MGKINKKKIKQKKTLSKIKSVKKDYKKMFDIKDCFIKLVRIEDIRKEEKKEKEREYNIGIQIHKDVISVGDKKVKLNQAQNVNIGLSFNLEQFVVECCSVEKPILTNAPKSLNTLINTAWRKCKSESKNELVIGQIIIAKMKGYSPWPGTVTKFTSNGKRTQILFFGTHETGTVDTNEVVRFELANDVIALLLLRPLYSSRLNSFCKGIREAECVLGITDENSITREKATLDN